MNDDDRRAEIARLQAELDQGGAERVDSTRKAAPGPGNSTSMRNVLIASGLVLAVAAVVAFVITRGSDTDAAATETKVSTSTPTPSPTPTTFIVAGKLTISKYDAFVVGGVLSATEGDSCSGEGGYDDIGSGTQVVVRSGDGDTLAVGDLRGGTIQGNDCSFGFTIGRIPEGHDFYSVEVADRGELTYSRSEVESDLAFTLG